MAQPFGIGTAGYMCAAIVRTRRIAHVLLCFVGMIDIGLLIVASAEGACREAVAVRSVVLHDHTAHVLRHPGGSQTCISHTKPAWRRTGYSHLR